MAGCFLFRKLSSGMSRSGTLLGAHAPASASAGAPATGPAASAAARCFNTSPFSSAAAKTSWRALPSAASNQQQKRYYWEVPENLCIKEHGKFLDRNTTTIVWLGAFIAFSWLGMFDNSSSDGGKNRHQQRQSFKKQQSQVIDILLMTRFW
ncbi:unnamed protein product [Urochloa humidicola]